MGKRRNKPDYEVGYGRPPRSGQFKPGQSGNPKGRPPKNKDIQTIIKDTLFSPMSIRENGRARTVPKLEAFTMLMMKEALRGDAAAANRLLRLLPLVAKVQAAPDADNQSEERDDSGPAHRELEREMLQHFVEMVKDGTFDPDAGYDQ
jgi:hypothetical protein